MFLPEFVFSVQRRFNIGSWISMPKSALCGLWIGPFKDSERSLFWRTISQIGLPRGDQSSPIPGEGMWWQNHHHFWAYGCLAKGKLLGWQSALPLSQHCWALLNSARGRTLSDKTRANPGEKVFCQQLLRYTLSLLHRHSPTCTAPLSSHTVPLGSQLRMLVA